MPTVAKADSLLFFTRLALTLLLGLAIIGGAAAVLAAVLLQIAQQQVLQQIADSGFRGDSIPWLTLMLALAAAMAALAFFFFRHLRRIVDSVANADPFVPINADRLRAMGWLSLGVQALLFALTPLVIWFDSMPDKPNVHHNEDGLSFGWLVLALLLFVLARVFRVGSQMRDELEGTV